MSRSDFGKRKKDRFRAEIDPAQIDYNGPFLKALTGYNENACKKYDWYWETRE
jgi:hypothetical protein